MHAQTIKNIRAHLQKNIKHKILLYTDLSFGKGVRTFFFIKSLIYLIHHHHILIFEKISSSSEAGQQRVGA